MLKSTWLMAISGLFLAATLIGAFPVSAQLQSGGLLNSYNQGSGTGVGAQLQSGKLLRNYQGSGTIYGNDLGKLGWKKPGQVKNSAGSNKNTHTLARPDHQPQSQTPGGTTIP
jgi:hypothetical protein